MRNCQKQAQDATLRWEKSRNGDLGSGHIISRDDPFVDNWIFFIYLFISFWGGGGVMVRSGWTSTVKNSIAPWAALIIALCRIDCKRRLLPRGRCQHWICKNERRLMMLANGGLSWYYNRLHFSQGLASGRREQLLYSCRKLQAQRGEVNVMDGRELFTL